MPQEVRKQKQGTIEYSANNRETESLGRGVVYRELMIRLTGQPTLTTANNTTAKTKRGDEWAVIRNLRLVANGTDVIKSLSGDDLWWLNYFMLSRPRITTAIGDGSANPSFDSVLILPLWMPGVIKPLDTALDARELSSLELEIDWGDHTSINGDATGWTTEPKVEIWSLASFNVQGPFSQWRVFTIEKEITADNPQFEIELPVGKLYRGFMIETTDADQDQADILKNFKLVSGSTVFADVSAEDDVLQQAEDIRRGTVPHYDAAANAYDDLRRSDNSQREGWYVYDHVTDGRLTEGVDTLGFSEFKIEGDVAVGGGTTKIRVIPWQVIPLRGGANG